MDGWMDGGIIFNTEQRIMYSLYYDSSNIS